MARAAFSDTEFDAVVASLHAGVLEQPPWRTFLHQAQKITGADYVSMLFRWSDARSGNVLLINSGDAGAASRPDIRAGEIVRRLRLPYDSIELNTPYRLRELVELGGADSTEYIDYLRDRHLRDTCVTRLREEGGGTLWLTFGYATGRSPAWLDAFLRRIARNLTIAMHTLAELERERLRARVAAEAVRKLRFGWLFLSAEAKVVEIDPRLEALFAGHPALSRGRVGQVFPVRSVAAELVELFGTADEARRFRPRAIHLPDEPALDMLVAPIRHRAVSYGATAFAVGYVHGVGSAGTDRRDQLVRLFGLTPSEARLALMLSEGLSIAEAAAALGFTIETARNYSKRIYAKTNTRGQADLVRIILAGVIALS